MIQFYKPNPQCAGHACSFFLTKDGFIMASMIKQDSWDSSRRTGNFKKNKGIPSKSVMTKLARVEIAGIIHALDSNEEWSAYHKGPKQVLQMKFCPYMDKKEEETIDMGDVVVSNDKATLSGKVTKTQKKQKGFSYSINKQEKEDSTNESSYFIWFTFDEAVLLKHALGVLLNKTLTVMTVVERVEDNEEEPSQEPNQGTKSDNDPFDDEDIF